MKKYSIGLFLLVFLMLCTVFLVACRTEEEESPLADYLIVSPCADGGYSVALNEACDDYPRRMEIPSDYAGTPIVEIAEGGFRGLSDLEEIVIADGIGAIRKDAFKDCTALVRVTLPDSLEVLEKRAQALYNP